jgi:4-hydroxy-3-methylbut-2-enyl diphosphate reductase
MKVILAGHFGLCFGVRDALAQAEALAAEAPLTILGQLVHNPIVRERLRDRGVREASPDISPEEAGTRVMVTAHGISDRKRQAWQRSGIAVADGTCPLVRHAHTQLKRLVTDGFFPVVIGQAGHVEVAGLIGDFPGACVLGTAADIAKLPDCPHYGVISQTTQPITRVRDLVDQIQRARPRAEVRFVDTVCKPTKDRQHALQELIALAETIVVVGGRESNNTRELAETCRRAGRRAIHIERSDELMRQDFANVSVVGLTAGTSTLPETVVSVHKQLLEFAAQSPA